MTKYSHYLSPYRPSLHAYKTFCQVFVKYVLYKQKKKPESGEQHKRDFGHSRVWSVWTDVDKVLPSSTVYLFFLTYVTVLHLLQIQPLACPPKFHTVTTLPPRWSHSPWCLSRQSEFISTGHTICLFSSSWYSLSNYLSSLNISQVFSALLIPSSAPLPG